jgi:hypothetical protein
MESLTQSEKDLLNADFAMNLKSYVNTLLDNYKKIGQAQVYLNDFENVVAGYDTKNDERLKKSLLLEMQFIFTEMSETLEDIQDFISILMKANDSNIESLGNK